MQTPTQAEESSTITRVEVAGAVGEAFGMEAVTRDELVLAAERAGARAQVSEALATLPAREFNDLRQLWDDLPDMPVR